MAGKRGFKGVSALPRAPKQAEHNSPPHHPSPGGGEGDFFVLIDAAQGAIFGGCDGTQNAVFALTF